MSKENYARIQRKIKYSWNEEKIDLSWKSNRNLELIQFYNKFGFAVRV